MSRASKSSACSLARSALRAAVVCASVGPVIASASDCDCSKIVAACTASVKADAQWLYLASTSKSCSDIRYHLRTSTSGNAFAYPQQSTITGGSDRQPWTGQGRITDISVDSCRVCTDRSEKAANTAGAKDADPDGVLTCAEVVRRVRNDPNSPDAAAFLDTPEGKAAMDRQIAQMKSNGLCR